MDKYWKLIGTIIGALLGILVAFGVLPEDLDIAELQAAIITVISAIIGTYIAPKNAT